MKYNAYFFNVIIKPYNLLWVHISANIDAAKKDNRWLTDGKPLTRAFRVKADIGQTETHIALLQTRLNPIAGNISP